MERCLRNRAEVVTVKARAVRYFLMDGMLYRRSFSGLYLRFMPYGEAERSLSKFTKAYVERTSGDEHCVTEL